eukprot:503043_1
MASSNCKIKHCSVLNYSQDNSTIEANELFSRNYGHKIPYIVSDCDEELLILIEFEKLTSVQNIIIYAPNIDVNDIKNDDEELDLSPPKSVYLYKIKNLNVNFDDIA